MEFVFRPVAQNTIIRPVAQAVCLMHGGADTSYIDPTDNQKKVITSFDVSSLSLEAVINGRKVLMNGYDVTFHSAHYPQNSRIKAEINDVNVYIYHNTTVDEAMAQFYKKLYRQQSRNTSRNSSRQREG